MTSEPTSRLPAQPWHPDQPLDPYVNYLRETLKKLGRYDEKERSLSAAIREGLEEGIEELTTWDIKSADKFCCYANYLLTSWRPFEEKDGRYIYKVLTVFYYIFDRPAINDLQTPISPSSIEGDMPRMTPLSDWIVGYAKRMGSWLSQPESLTPDTYKTFLTADGYRMQDPLDYHIPDPSSPTGGFTSFNDFFYRHLKEPPSATSKVRPVTPGDKFVVFPADSTFDNAWPIDNDLNVEIADKDAPRSDPRLIDVKTVLWPLSALLAGSAYRDKFKGGIWAHVFLNTYDYHRQHAPVAGQVKEAFTVEGCAYLQVEAKKDDDGKKRLQLKRPFHTPDVNSSSDFSAAQPDAPDGAGYEFIQQRGIVMIDTTGYANVGMVAAIPMGMAQVSSVKLSVKAGDLVAKGQEISWFEFGGSDFVLVFEKQAGVGGWPRSVPQQHHLVGQTLCEFSSVSEALG